MCTSVCTADIRYSKLAQPPEVLCKSLCLRRTEQSPTELEGLVVDLFSCSEGSFRHDKALEDKLFGKVLLLHKARKGRQISAAVAVREAKAKRRCAQTSLLRMLSWQASRLRHFNGRSLRCVDKDLNGHSFTVIIVSTASDKVVSPCKL
jgi:hypothetical protein